MSETSTNELLSQILQELRAQNEILKKVHDRAEGVEGFASLIESRML